MYPEIRHAKKTRVLGGLVLIGPVMINIDNDVPFLFLSNQIFETRSKQGGKSGSQDPPGSNRIHRDPLAFININYVLKNLQQQKTLASRCVIAPAQFDELELFTSSAPGS